MTTLETQPDVARTTAKEARPSAFRRVDLQLQHDVEQFLVAEAELLDDHRYQEWLALFTDDAHYWAPTRVTKTNRERDTEVSPRGGTAYFDDTKYHLEGRVRRLSSGLQWSEEPPSRTRRLVTNVRVDEQEDGSYLVRCNFYVYRSRLERHQDWFVGERFDVLRRADAETTGYPFVIHDRTIVLEQTTLLAPSLSILL